MTCIATHPVTLDQARSLVRSLPGPITAGAVLTALRGEQPSCCWAGAQAAYLVSAAAREMATETDLAREGQHAYTFEIWTSAAGGTWQLTGESPVIWAPKPRIAREHAASILSPGDYRIGAGYHERAHCCQEITAEPGITTVMIGEIAQDARTHPGHRATLLRAVIASIGTPARWGLARYLTMASARMATREG